LVFYKGQPSFPKFINIFEFAAWLCSRITKSLYDNRLVNLSKSAGGKVQKIEAVSIFCWIYHI